MCGAQSPHPMRGVPWLSMYVLIQPASLSASCLCACLPVCAYLHALPRVVRGSRLLLNDGHPGTKPTVVLGISGKPEKMCNLELVERDEVIFQDALFQVDFSFPKQRRDYPETGLEHSAVFA